MTTSGDEATKTPHRTTRYVRKLVLAIFVLGGFALGSSWYLDRLDPRLVARSAPGARGFVWYLLGDYQRAASAYRAHLRDRVAERSGVDPAWSAFVLGDFESAKRLAEARGSEDTDALLTLGEVALAERRSTEALAFFERVLLRRVDHPDAGLLASVAHARLGNDDAAVEILNRVLRHGHIERRNSVFVSVLDAVGHLGTRPANRPALCLLAHYHRYLRILDPAQGRTALTYARQAIAAGDRPDDAHLTIGVISTKQGQWDKALTELLEAVRLNPRNAEAARWASIVYARRGDAVNELSLARLAANAAPNDPIYAERLHHVLVEKLGDYSQALELYEQALATRPTDAVAWRYVADIHWRLGEDTRAIDGYRQAIRLAPQDYVNVLMLGNVYARREQYADALAQYERAATLAPVAADVHYRVAKAYHGLKRYSDAIAAYERSFALKAPDDADMLAALCFLYERTSAFDRAEPCVRTVLALDPDHLQAQRILRAVNENLAARRLRQ